MGERERGGPSHIDTSDTAPPEPAEADGDVPFSGEPAGGGTDHEHVDCAPSQRPWLETRRDQAATLRPHPYCVTCGKVKNLDGPKAKGLGFYLSGLSRLKEHLERSAAHPKMTQSQSRLITKRLEALPEFEDGYALSRDVQAVLYVDAVRAVRPDLEEELVLRFLPRTRRKERRPLLTRMTRAATTA